ncbi:ferrichrome-iron receptor [Dulcicalothrix desertica PCC 7102]|uniref:Ferrichrome-iron receptor n=1 Tax=Dulcicalothrix desertica PCC 7102 TaxID=232991 RepID=A0A433VML4_9CYAN|nr:TonB-dependent receptor [Dulcicalothrix desertica]RUT07368.1 ferrichrome-iron receptor [Dulcicalothrix desertica PCC 7102]TWH55438.1 iron complex outermembrane receptor protein [Dulcicalothrix desertica PCC 7102]
MRLQSGEAFTFRSSKALPGITEITVTNVDANTVRVTVVGEKTLPTVELFDDSDGLIFGVASAASVPEPNTSKPDIQTQPEQSSSNDEPIELVVTGEQDGYRVPEASTATKIEAPLRDIPASIQVIPKQIIQDRQVVRLNELGNNVSGLQQQPGQGGVSSQSYYIRGFAAGFENLRNGFRDFGFISPRDVANVEQVEFLKGPSSVLYGSTGSLGGAFNTITKKPLTEPFYQINATVGSYDFYRPTIDLTGSLTEKKSALYRLNVAYENGNNFRDFVDNESIFIAPALTLKVGERTNLTFEYEYQKYNYTFDRGFIPNQVAFDVPISRFLGEPDLNNGEVKSNVFTYVLEHESKDGNWKYRQGFNYINAQGGGQGVQGDELDEDGRTVLRRFRVNNDKQENISWQNEVSGKFNTGSIRHNVLLGFEIANYTFTTDFFRGRIAGLDIFNPVYGARPENVRRSFYEQYGSDNIALYLQNLIELTPNFKFLAGGRFDWVDSSYEDLEGGTIINETSDSKFSPRLGIVYQPGNSTSIYASWSNSFNPQFFGRSRTGEVFIPETGEQFEIGIKQELFDKRVSATLAFFDITRKNVLTTDSLDVDFQVQTGEQKSRGIELDIVGEITPGWKVIATYAYTDAFVNKDNDPDLVDDRLQGIPFNSASLWTTYEFQRGSLQGLGFGLGLVYAGEREATLPNDVKIPSYLRTDASIFYKQNNWRAAVNVKNLFDTKYYEAQGFFIVPAAPLTVLGTISFDF